MESEQDSVSVDKLMRRVRGLFAKAEGTDNEDEANIFRAKAYELLAKHNLDEMTVRASGQHTAQSMRDDEMVVVRFDMPVRYREPRSLLLAAVMHPLHCKGVHFDGGATVRYIGIRRHIRRGQFLYTLLLPQMFSAASRYVPEDPFDHAAVVRERGSFMTGFIAQVYERLAAAEADAIRTAGEGAALAIRSDVDRTEAAYAKKWPYVRKGRSVAHRFSGAGFEAGIRSGNAADVGHTRVDGGRRAIGS
ncbi:DUF2786 domain-containing protein [Nocardia transvalensis]|uniref:DUF2786 domain-containing protein n=1 Tax=Nocardia transvalensis TaxID=37333 RepID=UPI0018943177|nr:DUF2786 domain-containing protein [Nocardia transvalensis]MBF6333338.1 DUF2786 domain-containing protein [Nocardia transvalensis]